MNPRLSRHKSHTTIETNQYPTLGAAVDRYLSALERDFPGVLMQIAAGQCSQGKTHIDNVSFDGLYTITYRLFFPSLALSSETTKNEVTIPNTDLVLAMQEHPGIINDLSKIINNLDICYTVLNLNRIITHRDYISLRVLPEAWPARLHAILSINADSPFYTLDDDQQAHVRHRVQEFIAAALYQWLLSDINLTNIQTSKKIRFITGIANAIGQTPQEIIASKEEAFMATLSLSLLPIGPLINQMIAHEKKNLKLSIKLMSNRLNEMMFDTQFKELKIYSPAIVVRYLNNILAAIADTPEVKASHIQKLLTSILKLSIEFINKQHQILLVTEHGRSAVLALLTNPVFIEYEVRTSEAHRKLYDTFQDKVIEKAAKAEEKAQREALYRKLAREGGQSGRTLLLNYHSPFHAEDNGIEETSTSPSFTVGSDDTHPPKLKRHNTRARLNKFFHDHSLRSHTKSEGEKSSPSTESSPALLKAPSRETSPSNSPQPARKLKIRKFPIHEDGSPITEKELIELGVFATAKKPESSETTLTMEGKRPD